MAAVSLADIVLFTEDSGVRTVRSEGEYTMMWAGVFAYLEGGAYDTDPAAVARAVSDGTFDHNNMLGSYRIAFLDEKTGTVTAWGDNCGEDVFFYDAGSGVFSDSFLRLVRRRGHAEPCGQAVFNALAGVPELGCLTPVDGIMTTSPDCVYTVRSGASPEIRSKGMKPLDSDGYGSDYFDVISNMLKAIEGEKYSAVCTGGTDSRAVIAALKAAGGDPALVISGPKNHLDTRLAGQVADRLGKPLTVIDVSQKEEGWLAKAFEFSDGWYDTVLSYRHMKKTEHERREGIKYEFGGLGGEYYKLYYYHKGSGIPSADEIAHCLYSGHKIPDWLGGSLSSYAGGVYERLADGLGDFSRSERLLTFNDTGRLALRSGMNHVSNPISLSMTKLDPFMEPRVVAASRGQDTKTLYLHVWHREQIAKHAPELCDIPTDQGYNCSPEPSAIAADKRHARKSNTVLWIKRTGKKLSRRLANTSKNSAWNSDYAAALNTPEYAEALDVCRRMGFIAPSAADEDIPLSNIGGILWIGMLFSEKYGLAQADGDAT